MKLGATEKCSGQEVIRLNERQEAGGEFGLERDGSGRNAGWEREEGPGGPVLMGPMVQKCDLL